MENEFFNRRISDVTLNLETDSPFSGRSSESSFADVLRANNEVRTLNRKFVSLEGKKDRGIDVSVEAGELLEEVVDLKGIINFDALLAEDGELEGLFEAFALLSVVEEELIPTLINEIDTTDEEDDIDIEPGIISDLNALYQDMIAQKRAGGTDRIAAEGIRDRLSGMKIDIDLFISDPDVDKSVKEPFKIKKEQIEEFIKEVLAEKIEEFTLEQVVKKIKQDEQFDVFKYAEIKSPASGISVENRKLITRWRELSNNSAFTNEEIKEELMSSENLLLTGLAPEHQAEAKGLIFEYFRLVKNKELKGRNGAEGALSVLNQFLRDKGVRNQAEIDRWGLEIYDYLFSKDLDRIYWKVNLQLNTIFNEMERGLGVASTERPKLFEELQRVGLRREELMLVTTYHPDFGEDVRKALDEVIYQAALRSDEVVVKRTIKRKSKTVKLDDFTETVEDVYQKVVKLDENQTLEEFIAELEASGEEVIYKPDPNGVIFYPNLASKDGETYLSNSLSKHGFDDETLSMVENVYKVFDLLTISLAELQKNTQTRAHNADVADKDRISAFDPMSGAVHRRWRYPVKIKDFAMNILGFLDKLPGKTSLYSEENYEKGKSNYNFDDDSQVINANGDEVHEDYLNYYGLRTADHSSHQEFLDLQQALKEWNENFFDVFGVVPTIRPRGFCEPLGFSTKSLIELNKGEKCSSNKDEVVFSKIVDPVSREVTFGQILPDGTIALDSQGNSKAITSLSDFTNTKKTKASATEFKHYVTAEEKGFIELLDMLYSSPAKGPISKDDVLDLVKKMLSTWGKIKMFPGGLREMFVPFSYQYIMKAVHCCKDLKTEAEDLWLDIADSLQTNANSPTGLAAYKPQVAQLLNLLYQEPAFDFVNGNLVELVAKDKRKMSHSFYPAKNRFVRINRYKVTQWMYDKGKKGSDRPRILDATGKLLNPAKRIGGGIRRGLGAADDLSDLQIYLNKKGFGERVVNANGEALIQPKE